MTGFKGHKGIFLSPYDTGRKEFNRITIVKSILRTPWEDAVHKSTKDVAPILIPCKDKLTMKLIDKAAKLLSCESQPSCLREEGGTSVSRSHYEVFSGKRGK